MTAETCPRCGKKTLRIVNVMSTTETVHYACSNCCYKEKRPYPGKEKKPKQRTLDAYAGVDAEKLFSIMDENTTRRKPRRKR